LIVAKKVKSRDQTAQSFGGILIKRRQYCSKTANDYFVQGGILYIASPKYPE
jgi:hypothetical protein